MSGIMLVQHWITNQAVVQSRFFQSRFFQSPGRQCLEFLLTASYLVAVHSTTDLIDD
jgi:hypothetical protein